MQTKNQKSAVVEARSTRNQPITQMGELRDLLTTIERRIARLKEISAEDALEVLLFLDQASERIDTLDAAGGSGSSEEIQFESLLMQLEKKDAVFVSRVGGSAALRRARMKRQPDKKNWWWFIDEALAQKRQSKIKRWAIISAVIGVSLIVLALVYNQFLAPDPVFQAGIGFQQAAENKLIMGEYEEALAETDQAIQHLPDYPELYILQGVIYELLEQPDLSEQSYSLGREKYNNEESFYTVRAKYYLLAGLGEMGLADAEMALSINPDSAINLMYIGQAYELLGDISKAIDYYELASAAAEQSKNPTLQVMARMQIATLMQQINLPAIGTPQE